MPNHVLSLLSLVAMEPPARFDAQTIRNKKLLAEKDPAVRQKNHDDLRRQSQDPKLAREFLLRSSLINSVREAAQIP